MKGIFTLLILVAFAISANAQFYMYDFENGEDTTVWVSFANGKTAAKTDISVVLNPKMDTINSTDSVMKFVVHNDADPWVGMFSDAATVTISEESHVLLMMVHKTRVSPVGLKLELSLNGGATTSLYKDNTVIDGWQILSFDFAALKGKSYKRLTVFPDFPAKRDSGVVAYLDNIGFEDQINTVVKEFEGAQMKIYPNPADYRVAVMYPEMTGVKISNIQGQEMKTVRFDRTDSKVVEIGELKPGLYFATAITAKGNFTMQFLKK
jgi:hypothetical protein